MYYPVNVQLGMDVTKVIVGLDVLVLFPVCMVPNGVTRLLRVVINRAHMLENVMAVGVVVAVAPYNEIQFFASNGA
jgi:hypothetical protein